MSGHPMITRRQHRHSSGKRLGIEFLKRAARGLVMDRKGSLDSKNAKKVQAPSSLAKFFTPLDRREP